MTKATRLTNVERDSGAWQKLEAVIAERLKTWRAIVENPQQTEAARLGAAWRISELKELSKLGDQPTEPQDDAGD